MVLEKSRSNKLFKKYSKSNIIWYNHNQIYKITINNNHAWIIERGGQGPNFNSFIIVPQTGSIQNLTDHKPKPKPMLTLNHSTTL